MWRALGWLACSAGAVLPVAAVALTPTPNQPVPESRPSTIDAPAAPASKTDRVLLVCEAVYLPAREVWRRTVTIDYDNKRVLAVAIDNVPVYSFAVRDTVIYTALDNERIQIDTATQTWTSNLRGLVSSQGHCERGA